MGLTHPDLRGDLVPYAQMGTYTELRFSDVRANTVYTNAALLRELTESELQNLTNFNTNTAVSVGPNLWSSAGAFIGILFDEPYDLAAHIGHITQTNTDHRSWYYSTDTTNLVDGTWTQVTTGMTGGQTALKENGPTLLSVLGVKGVRLRSNGSDAFSSNEFHQFRSFLLWGSPSAEPPESHRLAMWDPTTDVPLPNAALDLDDIVQGNTATATFRVKNRSATKTAEGVVISANANTDTTDMATDVTFNDGTGAVASLNIGDLAPGAISAVITLSRPTAADEALGTDHCAVYVTPTSWA